MNEEMKWTLEQLKLIVARLEAAREPETWFPVYNQRDLRWAGVRLGPDVGGGTIGGVGCALTCAAMMATSVGCECTPAELNEWLAESNGFFREKAGMARNLLQWGKLPVFCSLLRYGGKMCWRSVAADIDHVRAMLEQGPVVAEVDFDYTDLDVDQHFVVLLWFTGEDEIEIADPWDGTRVGLVERYYNPSWSAPRGKVARVITGLRLLTAELTYMG